MRKRPLCFMCAALVLLNFVLLLSGDHRGSPDDFSIEYANQSNLTVYGEVYQCDWTNERQILYLKQTILSEKFPNNQNSVLTRDSDDNKIWKKLKRLKVTCQIGENKYQIGDKLCLIGGIRTIEPATNPGQFDSQSYYAGKKIAFTMWEPDICLLERPKFHMARFLYDIRRVFSDVLEQSVLLENPFAGYLDFELRTEISGVLRGIVLGDKGDISREVKQMYQSAGISHILAISAMHLTLMGNGFYGILKKTGLSLRLSSIFTGLFLILYGLLTGAGVATIRALLMFLIQVGAQLTGRTYDGKTSLSIAAVLLLSGNPLTLTDSGFLLSFSAMLSFAVFQEKGKIGSSVLLYLFMMPVVLWIFYEIPLYSIFVNLLIVPTLAIVLISGVFTCLLGYFLPMAGGIACIPAAILLLIYRSLCHLTMILPFSTMIPGRPAVWGILVYYGFMLLALYIFRKNRLSWKRFLVYLLMAPAMGALFYHPRDILAITALDVGQGDCIVVETPGHQGYLIDGGSSTEKNIGQYRIWPFLKHEGLSQLKAVFVTHTDSDHVSGIVELLQMIISQEIPLDIEYIVLPKWSDMSSFAELISLAEQADVAIVEMKCGDSYRDGAVTFTCLHPNGEDYTENPNEGSLTLHVKYGTFDGLLTGDLEGAGEEIVTGTFKDGNGVENSIEYLKVAHHGSGNSTCDEFLEYTNPRIGIISCGEQNSYGHPHPQLVQRLEKVGTDVYATKDCGAIWIKTDGQKIDLYTFCKYNKLEEWNLK